MGGSSAYSLFLVIWSSLYLSVCTFRSISTSEFHRQYASWKSETRDGPTGTYKIKTIKAANASNATLNHQPHGVVPKFRQQYIYLELIRVCITHVHINRTRVRMYRPPTCVTTHTTVPVPSASCDASSSGRFGLAMIFVSNQCYTTVSPGRWVQQFAISGIVMPNGRANANQMAANEMRGDAPNDDHDADHTPAGFAVRPLYIWDFQQPSSDLHPRIAAAALVCRSEASAA